MSDAILYESNEVNFNTYGIGPLSDATKVHVTEERNGLFTLEMVYPTSGHHFKELKNNRIIKANAGHTLRNQRFRISKVGKEFRQNGQRFVTVFAFHVSQLAEDLAMKPIVHILTLNCQEALTIWKSSILDSNPFIVSSDITTIASTDWHIKDVQNPRQALGGVRGSLLDKYGGEYKFDNYHISLLKQRGKRGNTVIAYGRNLTDLQQEESIMNTYTSIYPYAIYTENDVEKMITVDGYIIDSEHVAKYPNRKVFPLDLSGEFDTEDNKPIKDKVKKLAEEYIKNNNVGVPSVSMKLEYIDLTQVLDYKDTAVREEINLCDEIPVYFELFDINTSAKVIRVVWDQLMDRYDSIELGHSKPTFGQLINNIEKHVNEVQSIVNEVQIAANGKNMVFRGPDTPTAQNVGDSWYKPDGDDVELYIWDGATWEFIMSTKPDPKIQEAIKDAKETAEQAQEDAGNAMKKADESNANAAQAVSVAGFAKDQANQAQLLANSVNNQLPAIKQDAKDALYAYNNLSIGATNYIMNSSGKDELPTFDGINAKPANIALSSTADGWCKAKVTAASQTPYYFIGGYTPTSIYFGPDKTIRPGYEYTFSSQVRVLTVDAPVCLTMYVWDSSGLKTHFSQYARTLGTHDLELTIKVPEGATNILVGYRTPGIPPINDSWDFREAQLEASNKKSNWKSNPQDVQVQITKINGELSSKVSQTQFNLLQGTVTNQGTQINQNKTDIALKANQSEVNTLTGRVTAAEGSLIVQSSKIEGLVTKTDGQGVEIGALKVQSNSIQLQVSALPDYIQSRGQNLVTNGMGSLGDNTNFGTMVYDGADRSVGVGSFKSEVGGSAHFTSEVMPFDSKRIYAFDYIAKSLNSTGRFFGCIMPMDVDKNAISYFTMAGRGFGDKTMPFITKLTRPLKAGDMEVYVEDASIFFNAGAVADHRHSLIMWGYKNSKGYEYPVGTYSRLTFTNAWNAGDVNVAEKKIVFRKPFNIPNPNAADGVYPIGHQLSPTASGGSYIYPTDATNILLPKEWTAKHGKITGVDNYKAGVTNIQYVKDFVAYIKLGWLMNREVADTTWVNGITFSDVTEATENSLNIASLEVKANGIQATVATKADQTQVTQLANQWTQTTNLANEHTGQIANLGNQITLEVNTLNNTKADKTQLTLLQDQINLKVQKGDTISQINIEAGKTLIQTNSLILSAATVTFTGSAFIPTASIVSLNAEKINTGILNAANVKVINIDAANMTTGYINANRIQAKSITADKLASNAIQVGINAMGEVIKISPTDLSFYEAGLLACKIAEYGIQFWDGARKIGGMGENEIAGNSAIKGIINYLEYTGDYIQWGYKLTPSASVLTNLMYMDPRGKLSDYIGMHVDQDIYLNRDIGIKNAFQNLKFTTSLWNNTYHPALYGGSRQSGIFFGSQDLFLVHSNTATAVSDITAVTRKFRGMGTVQIPTSIRSDGSVASWRIITL